MGDFTKSNYPICPADRVAYIVNHKSMNIFHCRIRILENLTSSLYAWEKGIETGMYYLYALSSLSKRLNSPWTKSQLEQPKVAPSL